MTDAKKYFLKLQFKTPASRRAVLEGIGGESGTIDLTEYGYRRTPCDIDLSKVEMSSDDQEAIEAVVHLMQTNPDTFMVLRVYDESDAKDRLLEVRSEGVNKRAEWEGRDGEREKGSIDSVHAKSLGGRLLA